MDKLKQQRDRIKGLSVEELSKEIEQENRSLKNLKFSHSVTPIENPMLIRSKRKNIARLLTELARKEAAATK
jgi:large subunit ribosomal protein L29